MPRCASGARRRAPCSSRRRRGPKVRQNGDPSPSAAALGRRTTEGVPLHLALGRATRIGFALLDATPRSLVSRPRTFSAHPSRRLRGTVTGTRSGRCSQGGRRAARRRRCQARRWEKGQVSKTLLVRCGRLREPPHVRPAFLSRGQMGQAPPKPQPPQVLTSRERGGILASTEFAPGSTYEWENDPPAARWRMCSGSTSAPHRHQGGLRRPQRGRE